jgi:hypothetical protein
LAVFFFLGPFVRSAGAAAVEAGAGVVAGGLVVASAAVVSDPELDAFCAIAWQSLSNNKEAVNVHHHQGRHRCDVRLCRFSCRGRSIRGIA